MAVKPPAPSAKRTAAPAKPPAEPSGFVKFLRSLPKLPKTSKRTKIILISALMIGLFFWWGFMPRKASMETILCYTFAEQQVRYPETMQMLGVELVGGAIRVYYAYTDPFGNFRSDMIDCKFAVRPQTGKTYIASIAINRNMIDPAKVESFNKTLGMIVSLNPEIILPTFRGNDLKSLKRD